MVCIVAQRVQFLIQYVFLDTETGATAYHAAYAVGRRFSRGGVHLAHARAGGAGGRRRGGAGAMPMRHGWPMGAPRGAARPISESDVASHIDQSRQSLHEPHTCAMWRPSLGPRAQGDAPLASLTGSLYLFCVHAARRSARLVRVVAHAHTPSALPVAQDAHAQESAIWLTLYTPVASLHEIGRGARGIIIDPSLPVRACQEEGASPDARESCLGRPLRSSAFPPP